MRRLVYVAIGTVLLNMALFGVGFTALKSDAAPNKIEGTLSITLGCPVVHIPLYHIKPRTLRAAWRSRRRIRALLRERAIDIIAPDAPRDALTFGLAKLGTSTKMVWFVRLAALRPRASSSHARRSTSGGTRAGSRPSISRRW